MHRYTGIATASLLAAGALAQAAGAASTPRVRVNRGCYVDARTIAPIRVSGTGWTPGDSIELTSPSGALFGQTTANASGAFVVTIPGTVPEKRVDTLTLVARDQGNDTTYAPPNGQTAATKVHITELHVSTNPASAPFSRKVTFNFSGFRPGRVIYAHYLHRGHVAATAAFGRARGACGLLSKRARQYPGGHPRFSSYTVQFDNARRYSKRSSPRYMAELNTF